MRMSTPQKIAPARTEQIILFRASNQLFAISSASVQEVRSVDSLAGAAVDVNETSLAKSATPFIAAISIFTSSTLPSISGCAPRPRLSSFFFANRALPFSSMASRK